MQSNIYSNELIIIMYIGKMKSHKLWKTWAREYVSSKYRIMIHISAKMQLDLPKFQYLQNHEKYAKITIHFFSMPASRLAHIFWIITWSILLISIVVLYHYVVQIDGWEPSTLTLIDTIYLIAKMVAVTAIASNIVWLIFREIRHSGAIENIFVRRFLPIIQFIIIATLWIVSTFYVFDKLNIDTGSILAGAGIGGAILALAGKDIMTNLFGSLSILLSRTFDIGESIRVSGGKTKYYEGIVEEITLNYTKLTHISGEVIFIPNRLIYTEVVENLSRRRFFVYEYIVPFKKGGSNGHDVQEQLHIIEGKIDEYNPIEVEWKTENPNAGDFMYRISVKLPDENESFDRDIREFLTGYIFQGRETENSLQK